MTAELLDKVTSTPEEQRFVLPGLHSWQQFEAIEAAIAELPGVRITYFDGWVELMTIGENHEMIKSLIALLLGLYFLEKQIEFIPVGSATRREEAKEVSFEPDESYYIGNKKEHPDLAVEVVITSGGKGKLEKYKRFSIAEVWFWEQNRIFVYSLRGGEYELSDRSELLPDLDLALLTRCVLMPSKLEAMTEFLRELRQ